MSRALSVKDLLNKKYKLFEFTDKWKDAFGNPEMSGVWFVWGGSGNGKTTFVLDLVKYLTRFSRVAYNSLEESSAHTMQNAFIKVNMQEVAGRLILLERESIEDLSDRLNKQRSPGIVVIDSVQYADINFSGYKKLKEAHPKKLIIFISHAEGKLPAGRAATKIMFDATLKIWIEGYRAFSKGRYIGEKGSYTIWPEMAQKYWGE